MNRIPMLAAGHATVDFYQGAVPALVPFLVVGRGYGYVAVSGIVLAATLLSSVVQPLFGVLTDRWRMPWLIPVSMVVAGAGVAFGGVTDSYVLTCLAVALSGLGVAAYHPESARLARIASEGSHMRMSWFSLGGTLGFASAPVLVTPLLAGWGLGASPFLAVPAVAGVVLAPGPIAYVFIAASSIALYAPFSLHVTLGQDFLPTRVGTASGVTLGLAVSVGGLASPLVGAVAEAASLRVALACLIVFPVAAWLLARTLKEPAALEPA